MLSLKFKVCKICGKKALPSRRICYRCELARLRKKREDKWAKQSQRKLVRKEKNENSYKFLHKKAWSIFSKYIRQKGMDENGLNHCYTCGVRKHWKELHASHFFHGRLDFSNMNVHACCPQCNTFKSGNLAPYAVKLTEDLGGTHGMKLLKFMAENKHYSCEELKNVIAQYTPLIKS